MRPSRGFTLIELLTVVAIMAVLMVAVVPRVSRLMDQSRMAGSVNLVISTVSATKAFALRQIDFDGATYSGCALIFTPGGQMRIVENRDYLEDDAATPQDLERDLGLDGFADLPLADYTDLTDDLMIFGLSRGGGGFGDVKLLPPPFAIRINEFGNLEAGANLSNSNSWRSQVFYDGDFDGDIDIDDNRTNHTGTYNVDDWDERRTTVDTTDDGRVHIPFEQIEAVRGVVIISRTDYEQAIDDGEALSLDATGSAGSLDPTTVSWMMANGTVIVFNTSLNLIRYTPE